jgi:L-rhamnose isomerase
MDSARQIYQALPDDWLMFLEHKICESDHHGGCHGKFCFHEMSP